jgi:transcriptional regulator with XRE-family HTH domain
MRRIIIMKKKTLSDQIRYAVDRSGMSRYAICNAIGLNQSTMSRFMNGKAGLSLAVLDKLAEVIGLVVVTKPESNKGKG